MDSADSDMAVALSPAGASSTVHAARLSGWARPAQVGDRPAHARRAAGSQAGVTRTGRAKRPVPDAENGPVLDEEQEEKGDVMKALVFHGPGQTSWQDVPDPGIKDAADAVVRVDAVTICGTDLHIVKGDVPEVTPGRILGHEAVGTVVETGDDVRSVRPGDRVLISCISSCGRCRFCREGRYGQCRGGGGWVLGHTIDGTQAEYVTRAFR